MKTRLSLFLLLFTFSFLLSPCTGQIPLGFNYQAIARDAGGAVLPNTPLQVMLYIQSSSSGGTLFWKELHSSVTTNAFGLFSLVVGTGTRQGESTVATFDLIDWSVSPKYLKTEIYYSGSWKDLGTTQMYSVPFAMQARNSEEWVTSGTNIYRLNGNVGIGTSAPLKIFHEVGDAIINYNFINAGGIELGSEKLGTGNRFSGIDFHGDDTYTDYSLRILRYNSGPNATSQVEHRGTGEFFLQTDEAAPIVFKTTNNERMRIAPDGKVGIGTSPAFKLDVYGASASWLDNSVQFSTPNYPQLILKATSGGANAKVWRMIGRSSNDFEIQTLDDTYTGEVTAFQINRSGTAIDRVLFPNGKLGIGTSSSTSKVAIQPDASWDDNIPLFEVRNKIGVPIFAVYNNGVRILIDHTDSKAVKGGFAVGGYDMTKAGNTVNFMTISPDSIRFNINNDNVKAVKGGFAVGGYDITKGVINQDFMYITPQTSNNGQYNTFLGYKSGISNTSGKENVFVGVGSGNYNSTGSQNVFLGKNAGFYNRTGYANVIVGWSDLSQYPFTAPTNLGNKNTLVGYSTGMGVTGVENTSLGYLSGRCLSTGNYNCFVGSGAGTNLSTGDGNVIIGEDAGANISTGSENVFVGGAAGWSNTSGNNNVAVGCDAQVPASTGSNQVRIGDTRITYAGVQVSWTVTSDIKWKESVEDLSFGLNLVKGLRPVDYTRKNNSSGTREIGFIAQDVQKLLSETGIKNYGIISEGRDGSLELRYNDFIPILTKAIQEQEKVIESQQQQINELKAMVEKLVSDK